MTNCEEDVIQFASETEITLKGEIEQLEKEKNDLKDSIQFYQQRVHNEGISLHYDEATEIKGIIEQREHHFQLEIKELNCKYNDIFNNYQLELEQVK